MATTNMGLTLPVVSSTLGPQWATLVNDAFDDIDSHDHTAGNGKKVPVNGLNINTNLPLGGNSLTSAKSIDFSSLASAGTTTSSLSVVGGNLYFRDSASNLIQITIGGAVNAGGSGNISGLVSPGAATFLPGPNTFFWYADSGSNTLATMNMGSVALYPVANVMGPYVNLTAPTSMPSTYTMRLPTASPAASSVMMVRNAGAAIGQQEYAVLDGSTLEENPTGTIKVKTITDSNIADSSISSKKITRSGHSSTSTTAQTITPNGSEVVHMTTTFTPSAAPTGSVFLINLSFSMTTAPSSISGYKVWLTNTAGSGGVNGVMYLKLSSATLGTRYFPERAWADPGQFVLMPQISHLMTLFPESTTISLCFFASSPYAEFQVQNTEIQCVPL